MAAGGSRDGHLAADEHRHGDDFGLRRRGDPYQPASALPRRSRRCNGTAHAGLLRERAILPCGEGPVRLPRGNRCALPGLLDKGPRARWLRLDQHAACRGLGTAVLVDHYPAAIRVPITRPCGSLSGREVDQRSAAAEARPPCLPSQVASLVVRRATFAQS